MKNSEAPGATNSSNPKRTTRIPSTRTSHHGRVSPLLLADTLTLHLPRRLSTPSPHYGHPTLTTASIPKTAHPLALIHERCGIGVLRSSLLRRDHGEGRPTPAFCIEQGPEIRGGYGSAPDVVYAGPDDHRDHLEGGQWRSSRLGIETTIRPCDGQHSAPRHLVLCGT